jgi:hypothetical protein
MPRQSFRFAGVSALMAIPALLLSGVFLFLFFGGAGDIFGPLNDAFAALTLTLFVAPLMALSRLSAGGGRRWFRLVTTAAVAGLALAITGQVLLVARVISLEVSFVTGSLGILPLFAWGVSQACVGIRFGVPSRATGWALAAALTCSVLLTAAWAIGLDAAVRALSAALLASLVAFLAVLGRYLATYAETAT